MAETVIGGVVLFDYDGDGDADALFVDGAALPGYEGEAPASRLLRNDGGRFEDVSQRSGIDFGGYGNGAAAADVDGDGDVDLYLTALGSNALYRNLGDGRFEAVPQAGGADSSAWSTGAAFGDVDRDGDPDLYVANYVEYSIEEHRPCLTQGIEVYCHPGKFPGSGDHFFRNRGDGSFEEATAQAGLATSTAEAGLGVIFSDLDRDGFPDLFVANDSDPNFLFRNRADGTFEDMSLLSGTSYGDSGRPEAGMGLDVADVTGDGRFEIVVTHFEAETNALYSYQGRWVFSDLRWASGVAEPSLSELAFGVGFADFDHDGDFDLAIANGHILDNASEIVATSRFAQPNVILENLGEGRFAPELEAGLDQPGVSRGLATGDLDLDGDVDLVIVNSNDLAEAYENVGARGGWVVFEPVGPAGAPATGAIVEITAGSRSRVDELHAGSSYLSQHEARLHFGLGEESVVESVDLYRPAAGRSRYLRLPAGRRYRLP